MYENGKRVNGYPKKKLHKEKIKKKLIKIWEDFYGQPSWELFKIKYKNDYDDAIKYWKFYCCSNYHKMLKEGLRLTLRNDKKKLCSKIKYSYDFNSDDYLTNNSSYKKICKYWHP